MRVALLSRKLLAQQALASRRALQLRIPRWSGIRVGTPSNRHTCVAFALYDNVRCVAGMHPARYWAGYVLAPRLTMSPCQQPWLCAAAPLPCRRAPPGEAGCHTLTGIAKLSSGRVRQMFFHLARGAMLCACRPSAVRKVSKRTQRSGASPRARPFFEMVQQTFLSQQGLRAHRGQVCESGLRLQALQPQQRQNIHRTALKASGLDTVIVCVRSCVCSGLCTPPPGIAMSLASTRSATSVRAT
jgi:hypothetical protein